MNDHTPAPLPEAGIDEERKRREREFHNTEFAEGAREALGAAYEVAETANRAFLERALEHARGADVLEYGCGPGTYSFQYARHARHVVGIDISDVAIEKARVRAVAANATNTEFHRMDCESPELPDASFDLVCGRAILHHLDLERSFATISRLLKPGGAALFLEPLGHNVAINLFRHLTPSMRTVDEHPLLRRDLKTARRYFANPTVEPYACLALAAAPLHRTPLFHPALACLEFLDRGLLALPLLRWQGWTSIWTLK